MVSLVPIQILKKRRYFRKFFHSIHKGKKKEKQHHIFLHMYDVPPSNYVQSTYQVSFLFATKKELLIFILEAYSRGKNAYFVCI